MSWLCILLPHFEYMKKITLDSFQEPTARLVGWNRDSVSNRSQTNLRSASPVALCLCGGIWVESPTGDLINIPGMFVPGFFTSTFSSCPTDAELFSWILNPTAQHGHRLHYRRKSEDTAFNPTCFVISCLCAAPIVDGEADWQLR